MISLALVNVFVLMVLALLHLYWLLGGQWALNVAVPQHRNGTPLFRPGKIATLLVFIALLLLALCNANKAGWIELEKYEFYSNLVLKAAAILFLLRAIGEFNYIGFFKRFRTSAFARNDSFIYSPLCLYLSLSHIYMSGILVL